MGLASLLACYGVAWRVTGVITGGVNSYGGGRKLFTCMACIVVYMRKTGGALFCGVYIWRIL